MTKGKKLDPLAKLDEQIGFMNMGFIRHENHETGDTVFFPKTATDADEWEQRAIAQNAETERLMLANRIADKPMSNELAERQRRPTTDLPHGLQMEVSQVETPPKSLTPEKPAPDVFSLPIIIGR